MREVIERMLEIERRARTIVARAEAEATRLTDAARGEARLTVEHSRQAAVAQVDGIIREAKTAAEKEKAARLAQLRQKFQAESAAYEERVGAVAAQVAPLLLGSPPGKASSPTTGAVAGRGAAGEPAPPRPAGPSR